MLARFLSGITVEIHDERGVAFPEHPLEAKETVPENTAVTHLEIIAGARFVIVVKRADGFKYRNDDLEFRVRADGEPLVSRLPTPASQHRWSAQRDASGNDWGVRHFYFAGLKTTEEQANEEWLVAVQELGEIKVEVRPGRALRRRSPRQLPKDSFGDALQSGVPEKAMKGRTSSTRVSLGEFRRCKPAQVARMTYPWGKQPIATFIFKYATRGDLQSRGVIAREPSPVPLDERDPSTLTPDESQELIRLLQARVQKVEGTMKKIKRERQDNRAGIAKDASDKDADDVVETQTVKRRRILEIIDLSVED